MPWPAPGALPSRRVTGRLLFARGEIERWLRERRQPTPAAPPPAVLAGSHDPLLDWALRRSGCGIASFCDGSLDGLARLAGGEAALAGVHLAEGEGAWNRGHVRKRLAGRAVVAAGVGVARARLHRGRRQSAGYPRPTGSRP